MHGIALGKVSVCVVVGRCFQTRVNAQEAVAGCTLLSTEHKLLRVRLRVFDRSIKATLSLLRRCVGAVRGTATDRRFRCIRGETGQAPHMITRCAIGTLEVGR